MEPVAHGRSLILFKHLSLRQHIYLTRYTELRLLIFNFPWHRQRNLFRPIFIPHLPNMLGLPDLPLKIHPPRIHNPRHIGIPDALHLEPLAEQFLALVHVPVVHLEWMVWVPWWRACF